MRLNVLVLGAAAILAVPASAAQVSLGASAPIRVDDTAGACVTVTAPGLFAGQFSAAGMVTAIIQDGVVIIAPIAGVEPLVGNGSASACIPGVYGAHSVRGTVVYTVTVTGPGGDYAQVLACTFGGGTITCT